jgi:hypothetical protein
VAAAGPVNHIDCYLSLERILSEDPWAVRQWMGCFSITAFDGESQSFGARTNEARSLRQVHTAFFSTAIGRVAGMLMVTTQSSHPFLCPAAPAPRF